MDKTDLVRLRELLLPDDGWLDSEIDANWENDGAVAAFERLAGSKPFRKRFAGVFAGMGYGYRSGPVETIANAADAERLFDHIRSTWEKLGREDPHWSVLSKEDYRKANAGGNETRFFRSGEAEIENVLGVLRRCGLPTHFGRAAEFGCGLGRMSLALATHCERLEAYDISRPHLDLAAEIALERGRANIEFRLVQGVDHPVEPGYDFFYSWLVFQHNPPAVTRHLLARILEGLAPGGAAMFQVPVHRKGYRFRTRDYLASARPEGVEMHCVPQMAIFDIIRDTGCRLMDLTEVSVSLRDRIISNLFTVVKPREAARIHEGVVGRGEDWKE